MRYVIIFLFMVMCLLGWGNNIFDLIQGDYQSTGEMLVRAAGIFVAPIGVIMGLFF